MTDLVKRLEGASGGSRELSDEVLLALRLTCRGGRWCKDWDAPGKPYLHARRYDPTENLQDAVDLVTVFHAYIDMTIEPVMDGCDTVCTAIIRIDNDTRHVGTSATAALALSAANVKAMETETAAHE